MKSVDLFSSLLALSASALADDFSPPNSKSHPLRLWYSRASTYWNDSMPIGNGRLGGMIRGVTSTELISINEDSFWAGTALDRLNPDAKGALTRIQPWLLQGNVSEATLESNLGLCGLPSSMREYMPGGDFQIVFQGQSSAKNYERWLDLEDGTAGLYYTAGSTTYKREYFASNPMGLIAVRLTASTAGSLNFYIRFQRPSNQQNRFAEESLAENGDTILSSFLANQISAVFGARVHNIGGSRRQIGDAIQVTGADEAWIYLDMETSVREHNLKTGVRKKLGAAIASTYPDIRAAHVADYQSFSNRTSVDLGESSSDQKALATDARRNSLGSGAFDPELFALYFQYGRYLLISTSRAGTFPPNLQGIWNNDFNPAWGSKYTININLQMNYWPAEVTNLGDLTEPLFSLMETMYDTGKKTARDMYGASGWVAHHNTDIWGDTAPQDISGTSTYWPLGHVWLLSHVYDHYLYSGDTKFLKKFYGMMNDAAAFFEDYLVDYKGWKVTNPSVSPENSYKNGSTSGALTIGPTMDNSLLRELFANMVEATSVLGEKETSLVKAAKSLKDKLPPLRVSPSTGVLMEWIDDFVESEPGHRHMSPVYGLYPGGEITPADANIWKASAGLVDRRVSNGGGSIGWSRAWISALYARLYRGADTQTHLTSLLYNFTYNSLLNSGPPAGFQIDGNFGGAAAIAETLLHSHNDVVRVLPSRMPGSTSGSFKGLVARGGFVVDAAWENGLVTEVDVLSKLGNPLNLTIGYGGGQTLALQGTEEKGEGTEYVGLKTTAGSSYRFTGVR